ncbi:MAG: phage holin family protein [Thiomonas sp.]|uniref:phage holin family protein n=1 Tax=Thiomonas sp. TaxID=2047785 RepID=UPI002A35D296|nr:phage holin family protein [Thiomonas sp.]MDY0331702.1 phage holin family protein [Thiomonas sp.]
MASDDAQPGQSEGLGAAGQRLLGSAAALLQSRIELAGIELAEERQRLVGLLVLGTVVVLFGLLALGSLTALLVILFWDRSHWLALALLCLLDIAVVAYCIYRIRAAIRQAPAPFATSRAELAKDAAIWRSRT